ncbi:mitochondrial ribosome assembly protein RRG9 [Kluyveromyces lactis]|uniref:Required for respiratory growth protein 9, mitochondrial n=1 Tax=Kluyveromyces lactis (strain ATCC 8585 / CBS 2359 / DSM 70799 / NBRC 1267 / NRRL Y-1140 / WM37) TaxID=284590 RepID=RRG9_KLULA|nr:uncharacterized protein KLLA0_D19184g [Kluyveromyces lactis]Q6CQ76.1 RecName: Full=Required for respiratory growth protein 9, mitochondrial; Flags: Precursor [Kluyveromyces lactis NRRL Y-1140]CAH01009.1 KLLA0D19184p [Kluyveromyces lactis]|eukprot:XP_453913.1 uncharacterized protein KLLA0_D19184g [Kluyveromyces lactis]
MFKLCGWLLPRSRTLFELRKAGVMPFHSTALTLSENDKIDSSIKVAEIPKKGKAKRLINTVNRSKDNDGHSTWRDNTALPDWKRQKFALKEKLNGERWNPKKKLSREQMETVRLLKRQFPHMTSGDIAIQMKVSPEVVRRILKSKWEPTEEELEDIQRRWKKRSDRILDLYENGKIDGYTGIIPVTRKVVIGGPNSEHIIHRKKPQQDLGPSNKLHYNKSKHIDRGAVKARNNLHLLLKKKI